MSRWGTTWSSAWGEPGLALEYCLVELSSDKTRLHIRFKPRAGLADEWFVVYLSGRKLAHVLAPSTPETVVECAAPYGSTELAVHVLHVGGCSDTLTDLAHVARGWESIDSRRVTLQFAYTPEVLQPDAENDGGYTSAWALAGLGYGVNVETAPPHITRGRLRLLLTVAAGTATVTLQRHNVTVAAGSALVASLPGTVTLAEANGSGLSGSLTLAAAVADTTGWLYVRWPKAVRIYRDAFNPPTTLRATVLFEGRNAARWVEASNLAAGTHYYKLAPLSDTDDEGTAASVLTVSIPAPPAPPTNLAYKSGAATATVLQFTGSTTSGATYRAYLQQPGDAAMDFNTIAATAIAGATQIALPAVTGYAGTARVVLRAVYAGLEEQNNTVIEIEYDAAGVRVAPRPNPASLDETSLDVDAGLTVNIAGIYDANGEAGTATQIKLFSRAPGGAYNYASPDDTETLVAAGLGLKKATLSKTFASAGWYYLRALAYTAAGVPSNYADCPELAVYVSDSDIAAPTNVQASVARG